MRCRDRPDASDRPPLTPDGGVVDAGEAAARRVVVLNPVSGDGSHVEEVHDLAARYGYAVYETRREGHGVELAEEAVEHGANVIAACGGDGTVNEVVRGVDAAGAFDEVTVGVLPGGTGNNLAQNVGVETIQEGFEVLEGGRTRQVDLGVAGDRPFVSSCVGGLTAEASSAASSDLKRRVGVLAYVVSTLRELPDFEGFDITVADPDGDETLWEGSAVCVHVGNARRFGSERVLQADMEDGLLDVTIVEAMPPPELLETAAVYRLFGEDRDSVTRLQTPALEIDVEGAETVDFSLDGEMLSAEQLTVSKRDRVLSLRVGDGYDPHPDESR